MRHELFKHGHVREFSLVAQLFPQLFNQCVCFVKVRGYGRFLLIFRGFLSAHNKQDEALE